MTATTRRRGYTLEADLAPIMEGKVALPNFEPWPDEEVLYKLDNLTLGGLYTPHGAGLVKLPMETHRHWAKYFLVMGQGGGFTGEGYVIFYGGWTATRRGAHVGRFAICKHQPVEDPGANHSRGWHPSHCGLCGLDMSVDSGD